MINYQDFTPGALLEFCIAMDQGIMRHRSVDSTFMYIFTRINSSIKHSVVQSDGFHLMYLHCSAIGGTEAWTNQLP